MSKLVVDEYHAGDPDAAQERLSELTAIPRLQIIDAAQELAARFGNDLAFIVADLRRQESESVADFVSLPGRPATSLTN